MNTLNQEQRVLRYLQDGAVLASTLQLRAQVPRKNIAPIISRLRKQGYKIHAEITSIAGCPRYELLAGPRHMGTSFTCPECSRHIELLDRKWLASHFHADGCKLG